MPIPPPLLRIPFLCLLLGCGPGRPANTPSPLDYVEISGQDGWYLRVHGDGSGTLTHRQHPTHHLEYPPVTFDLPPLLRMSNRCRSTGDPLSFYRLVQYRSLGDRTRTCHCAGEPRIEQALATAIANMQLAVDDAGSERACRMLRRTWLAAR